MSDKDRYYQKYDKSFVDSLYDEEGLGARGGRSVLNDVSWGPTKVPSRSVEELFVQPHAYETRTPWNLSGFYDSRSRDKFFFDQKKPYPNQTRAHEIDHVFADKAPPQIPESLPRLSPDMKDNELPPGKEWVNRSERFKRNTYQASTSGFFRDPDSYTTAPEFVKGVANILPAIKKRFPTMTSIYMNPEWLMKSAYSDMAFNEILAELYTLEKEHGVDILNDPDFKPLWTKPGAYKAYRAMTGLRNTILDPKDIPAQSIDTGEKWYKR